MEKEANAIEEFNKETKKTSIEEQQDEKEKAGERKIKRLLASASQVGSFISYLKLCSRVLYFAKYYGCGRGSGS